jgi:hypothetical protein
VPVWPCALSGRLLIVALVGRYPTNKLISRGLLSRRLSPFPFRAYAVLAPVSQSYSPPRGRLPTCYSPVRHFTQGLLPFLVRLACVKRAASVDSEPGSNSRLILSPPPSGSRITFRVRLDCYSVLYLTSFRFPIPSSSCLQPSESMASNQIVKDLCKRSRIQEADTLADQRCRILRLIPTQIAGNRSAYRWRHVCRTVAGMTPARQPTFTVAALQSVRCFFRLRRFNNPPPKRRGSSPEFIRTTD